MNNSKPSIIQKYKVPFVILFLVLLVLSIFVILVVAIFILLMNNSNIDNNNNNNFSKLNKIQEISINNSNGSKIVGFSHLPTSLLNKNTEYIFYTTETSNSNFLISSFGGENFKCTGSCFCTEEEEKRRNFGSTKLLNSGLFIVFSAISTILAINIAKDIFHSNCLDKYSSVCNNENGITSEVDNCFKLSEVELDSKELVSDEDEELDSEIFNLFEDSFEETEDFICSGFCVSLVYTDPKDPNVKFGEQCESYELTGVEVKLTRRSIPSSEGRSNKESMLTKFAKSEFISYHLEGFCLEISQLDGESEDLKDWDSYCVGSNFDLKAEDLFNTESFADNVECQRVSGIDG